jgi:hypothetical protein
MFWQALPSTLSYGVVVSTSVTKTATSRFDGTTSTS